MLRGLTESFKLLTLPCWARSTPSFAPPGECAELELDCCRYYLTGRGLRLPLRSQVACVELELDCCCYYAAGRGLRLPLLCQAE